MRGGALSEGCEASFSRICCARTMSGSIHESSPVVPDRSGSVVERNEDSSTDAKEPRSGTRVAQGVSSSPGGSTGSRDSNIPSSVLSEKVGEGARAGERPWMERVRSGDGAPQ